VAYALCRPPGHHAYADRANGFCYLNNVAIAAQQLRRQHARVAILDIDVHHGNGTQGIFYSRADVLTVSLHADPKNFTPFFVGHAHERGEGAGLGYNINRPLALGTNVEDYLRALRDACASIRAFSPGALVVALGLDAHERDPYKGLAITTAGFAQILGEIARLGLPTVLVQEGGYLSDDLGPNLASALRGFENAA
jgi:acetoin utilization deacetylase AcuC-like enzyme